MKIYPVSESVYCLHADIQTKDLFEGIWPIPHGVSLNCYLVKGKKTALIDLIRDEASGQIEKQLNQLGLGYGDIDYLILNHLEPDHTGWLREFRLRNPNAKIISTAKGIKLVNSFYKINEGLMEVKDNDELDLENGIKLRFFETPNIHWPETMMCYEAISGTLFSCDAFGSYGALGDRVFDDQFSLEEHLLYESESLRYYSNIVASFSAFVDKALQKLKNLDIRCVAPSHGIVYRKNPGSIIQRYINYSRYARKGEKEICVIWGSMYGNTKKGVDAVVRGIKAEGLPCTIHRIPDEDASYVLQDAYKSSGLVIAMPTYEYAMFPPMANILDLFRRKHITGKTVLRVGSWGWSGGAQKEYETILEKLSWKNIESTEWSGSPEEGELATLEERGRQLARIIKNSAE